MNHAEAKEIVRQYLMMALEKREQGIHENGQLTEEQIKFHQQNIENPYLYEELTPTPYKEQLATLIEDMNLSVEEGSSDYDVLRENYRLHLPDFSKELLRLNTKFTELDLRPTKRVINAQREASGVTIEEAAVKLESEAMNDKRWTDGTAREFNTHIKTLIEILAENFDVSNMDRDTARYVLDTVRRIPSNRQKSPLTRNRSLLEACEVVDIDCLSDGSVTKYINNYHQLFEWCLLSEKVEKNYFRGLNKRKKNSESSKGKRKAFPPEHTKLILDKLESDYKGIESKEHIYWGVLIAFYTGMRLNEIAQLELTDVREKNGMWYFDLNTDGGKSLKNTSAERKIPIHDALVKLGILKHKNKVEKLGKTRLLHQLTYTKDAGYGRKLTRHFNEVFLTNLGIKEKNVVFHCTRHSFNTRLLQSEGVDLHILQSLMGHAPAAKMTALYGKEGYLMAQLSKTTNKLRYEI